MTINTLYELARNSVEKFASKVAFSMFEGDDVTYAEVGRRIAKVQEILTGAGLQAGDKVALLSSNMPNWGVCYLAVTSAGMVAVPILPDFSGEELDMIIEHSEARALLVSDRLFTRLSKRTIERLNVVVRTKNLGVISQRVRGEGTTAVPAPDDLAVIIYTSGTTGRPKGVMLSHGNIVSNVQQISRVCDVCEEDVYLSYLPFSHTFERTVAHYTAMAHGASLAFARSVANLEHDLIEVRPTLLCSVPRVYERIYQKIQTELARGSDRDRYLTDWMLEVGWRRFAKKNDLPVESTPRMCLDDEVHPILDREVARKIRKMFGGRLRATFAGGASLNYTVAKFFSAMGLNIQQVYGLTETSPILSWSTPEGNHPDTVGLPAPGTEARLGENDELQVKGPQVMQGYWNRPEDTKAAFTEDGWFRTGDLGEFDKDGWLYIKGRLKNMIVGPGGENIYPEDIESVLNSHVCIADSIVTEHEGRLVALVHFNREEIEAMLDDWREEWATQKEAWEAKTEQLKKEIMDFVNAKVSRFSRISEVVEEKEEFVKTPTHKIKRFLYNKRGKASGGEEGPQGGPSGSGAR